ncbi:MAG: hypothetical protein IPN34_10875 [Planctomycetes bacterium]|nr:hypothetical protein [Planctomycetota bacterium]
MSRFAFPLASALLGLASALPAQAVFEVPRLPVGLSSFGAARLGSAVHVAAGHVGRAHAHARENLSERHLRLDLAAPQAGWTALAPAPAVQGTALVAHDGRLYRLGGLRAENAAGEPEQLRSLASVACFDPARGAWEELSPLPEPRSSHDACVVGDRVYVVGGWSLGGEQPAWLRTAWTARLDQRPLRWEALAAPTTPRRAAALATCGDSLVFVGGMHADGASSEVELLALAADGTPLAAWSAGPALPGPGFGTAACTLGERCFATSGDGVLWELASDRERWIERARLAFPRIFHRLLPWDAAHLLALGGADRTGHLTHAEVLSVDGALCFQRVSLELPREVGVQRASVHADAHALTWIGGNRRAEAHRFDADDFARAALRVRWCDFAVEELPSLASGLQSAACLAGERRGALHVLGGFGCDAEEAQSRSAAWSLEPASRTWKLAPSLALPQPRTQAALLDTSGAAWLLGGLDYDPARGEEQAFRACLEVLRVELAGDSPRVVDTGWRLPRARRACAAFVLGSEAYLVGGLGERFEAVEVVDVLDLESGAWRTERAPRATRLSAQAVALGARAYLAGGTLPSRGAARSLEVFEREHGWRELLPELPFATQHQELVVRGSALAFLRVEPVDPRRLVVHVLAPHDAPTLTAFSRN